MPNSAQFQIKLAVNSSGVGGGIASAAKQFDRLKKQIAGLLIGGRITNFAQQVIEWGSSINDGARTAGFGVKKFQEYSYAAKESGVELNELSASNRKLKKAQIDAINGNKDARSAFDRLGISVEDLKNLTPEQLFEVVGRAMAKLPASAQATADAMTLMGKSGDATLSAFRDGFFEAAEEAKRLGLVVEDKLIEKLDQAGDSIDRLALKFRVTLAPAIVGAANLLVRTIQHVQALGTFFGSYSANLGMGKTRAEAYAEGEKAMRDEYQRMFEEENAVDQANKEKRQRQGRAATPEETGTTENKKKGGGRGERQNALTSLQNIGERVQTSAATMIPQRQLNEAQKTNGLLASMNSNMRQWIANERNYSQSREFARANSGIDYE